MSGRPDQSVRVFVSSTSMDLETFRCEARDTVLRLGHHPVCMDDFVADNRTPLTKCLETVRSCHIYVGIFAWRYGYVPDGYQLSVTEMEYKAAMEAGLPILAFLLDEQAPWPSEHIDKEYNGKKIRMLRETLARDHVVSFFIDSADLARKISAALGKQFQRLAYQCRVVGRPFGNAPSWFKNRTESIQQLCSLLGDNATKMICIVGRPGIGKTSLLAKVCRRLEIGMLAIEDAAVNIAADGIIYIGFDPDETDIVGRIFEYVNDLLPSVQSSRLTIRWRDSTQPLKSKVKDMLAELRFGFYLLVLDNFERALDKNGRISDPTLKEFMETALSISGHALRIVVTSSATIALGEYGVGVTRTLDLEALPEADAMEMLRDLDVQGSAGLLEAPDDTLLKAVRQCHGVPYALTRLAGLLIDNHAATLPGVLSDSNLFNEQVVDNLTAEQYRRLSRKQKMIMEAIAVLGRPDSVKAIKFMLQPFLKRFDPTDNLRYIVRILAVRYHKEENVYDLHPLDQAYVYSRIKTHFSWRMLSLSPLLRYNRKTLHARAADYCRLQAPPRQEWLSRKHIEEKVQELYHLIHAELIDRACEVLDSIGFDYLWLWGYCEETLSLYEALHKKLSDENAKTWSLGNQGLACWSIGRFEEAIALSDEAAEVFRAKGNHKALADCLVNAALARSGVGEISQAMQLIQDALDIDRALNDVEAEGRHLCDKALIKRLSGDFEEAIRLSKQGIELCRQAGNQRAECNVLANLAECAFLQKDVQGAEHYNSEGLQLAEKIDSSAGKSYHYLGLARAQLFKGSWQAGLESSWLAYCEEFPLGRHTAALYRGFAHMGLREDVEAAKAFRDAHDRCTELLNRSGRNFSVRYVAATASLACNQPEKANEEFKRGIGICCEKGVLIDVLSDIEIIEAAKNEVFSAHEALILLKNELERKGGGHDRKEL